MPLYTPADFSFVLQFFLFLLNLGDMFRYRCSNACWNIFFQAEDGIRDDLVTGVQTCALPISAWRLTWDTTADAEEFVDAFKEYGDARFGVAAAIGGGSLCWGTGEADSCLYFTPQATLWILAPDEATLEKVRDAIGF